MKIIFATFVFIFFLVSRFFLPLTYNYAFVFLLATLLLIWLFFIWKRIPAIIVISSLLLLLGLAIRVLFNREDISTSLFFFLSIFCCFLISYWFTTLSASERFKVAISVYRVYLLIVLFQTLKVGWSAESFNEILPSASRNFVSGIALFSYILLILTSRAIEGKVSFVDSLALLVLSVLTYGRSGIALSIVVVFINYSAVITSMSRFKKFLAMLLFFILVLVSAEPIIEYLSFNSNFDQGFESDRFLIYDEYFDSLDTSAFMIGQNVNTLPVLNWFNNNPHNSFIRNHILFGVFGLLSVFTLITWAIIRSFANGVISRDIKLLLIIVVIVRMSLDTMVFPGVLDVLFISVLFLIGFDERIKSANRF